MGIILLLAASCEKYEDVPGQSDPRLSRKYCNDPEAVNFNRDFPGTADNSVCFYPADAFAAQYSFIDSIYDGGNKLLAEVPLLLTISADSRTKMSMTGFCPGSTNPIKLTANQQLRAFVDTTVLNGQLLCRVKDTLSGYISQKTPGDTLRLKLTFTVVSDTGLNYHEGTAYRQ